MTKITAIFKANKTEDCMCLKHQSNFMVTQVQVYFFIQSHVN